MTHYTSERRFFLSLPLSDGILRLESRGTEAHPYGKDAEPESIARHDPGSERKSETHAARHSGRARSHRGDETMSSNLCGSIRIASAPALIGLDEFRLAIPWWDALQQGPPPLHQPEAVCSTLSLPVEEFTANGELSLNCLSHPRGQAQLHAPSR